jgi:surface antigen
MTTTLAFLGKPLMSTFRPFALFALGAALVLAACNSSAPPATAVAPAAPEPPGAGVVGVSVGQNLSDKDKEAAIAAQHEAVNSGARKTWKGSHGVYGYIEPGPESGSCRDYTHHVFVNGRPTSAKGQACRKADGVYRAG